MVAEASLKFPGSRILRKFELDDFFIEINIDLKTQEDAITTILELQSTGSHERNGDRTDFLNFRIRTIYSGVSELNALGCVRLRSLYGHKGSSLPRTARGSEATTLYSSDGSSSASDNDTSPTTSPLTTSFIHSDRDTELELQKPVSRGIDGHAEQYVQSSPQQKIVKTLPMSFGPSGFWFMTQFVGDPTFFNGTVSFLITANLDIQFLSRLVHEMAGRHEGLRTAFFADSSHQPSEASRSSKTGVYPISFHFYVTVFQVLLSRLAKSEDICIGVASANRHNDPGSEDSIGIFLNLFPLRLRSQMSKPFLALLKENKDKTLAAMNHSAVPFDVILDEVGATRHSSHSPLFQTFINYIPTRESRSFRDGTIENNEYEIGETLYDIMLAIIDPPSGDPWIAFMVQKELYTEREAQILLDCFINLMDAFTSDIHVSGLAPQMFSVAAIQNAIHLGQGTSLDIGLGSLNGFLDDISTERASEIALQDTHGAKLSYAEMMNKSTQIAHTLSVLDVAAILIHDATRTLCEDIDGAQTATVVDVDEAIVLYTSGSTGTPKGISLPHRIVTNTIRGFLQTFPMKAQTVLQQIALSFDVSWWQSLLGLAIGGTVIAAGKDVRRDPFALIALIISQKITLTLARLRQSAWEWHISTGEEVNGNLVERFRRLEKLDLRFLNAYGPAKTIIPNAYDILYQDRNLDISSFPIGKAMPNYSVYIMDQDNHPLPAGVPGQIVIGGAGVASGYINQPNLTATGFPKDTLASARAVANGWIQTHLSGGRGYMREDGVFVALGRINGDTQVKLRGQRFELREVEVAMVAAGQGGISEAVCHIRCRDEKDAASAFLVAHVTLPQEIQKKYGTNGPVIDSMLRNIVSSLALPQYMRPSVVVALQFLPLNHHGKVDRKLLSKSPLKMAAEPPKSSPRFIQSRSPQFQNEMAAIWRDILGDLIDGQKLEEGSDFFLVGGNSLLLIKVQSKIKERTRHDIPLAKLFGAGTLGKMAAILRDNQQYDNKEQPVGSPNEGKMKQIWLSVLGDIVSEDVITSDADFFLVGGNSLLLIGVQNEVHKQFGALLPLVSLFEASTLGQMVITLDTLTIENHASREIEADIDWNEEVAFHEQLPAITSPGNNHELNDGSPSGIVVVLTGATGFLVIIYPGDLRDPLLGLSDDAARRVFSQASAVIHNGADVSFLRTYWTLRAVNVLSTKALVQLAIKHAIDKPQLRFHFVSTAGVVQLGADELYEEAISVL
ncbi:acetyl-CoA synthetase-like protein [Trichoderma asperelloides]|nr:acetyl-CoA synthetase-like protein [Trichoderma asperelloides]